MSEEIKSIVLKNKLLQPLVEILDCQMSGAAARGRNRFVTIIGAQLVVIDKERRRLYSEAACKDDKGEPITKKVTNPSTGQLIDIFDLTPEADARTKEELNAFLDEDFIIDILPSTKFDVEVVSKAVLNTTKEFGLVDGASYDLIAQAFETTTK